MHICNMPVTTTDHIQEKRDLLVMGNRWINTIYTGYGATNQRILIHILELLQPDINKVMNGKKVSSFGFKNNEEIGLNIDLSKISHYNNYWRIRQMINEMSTQPIQVYNDPSFKSAKYFGAPLISGYRRTNDRKIITVFFTKQILELLLHVDYKQKKSSNEYTAAHFTKIDPFTVRESSTKYMWPLYSLISSWGNTGGFTMDIEELRMRLQVEEKYKGFDNFHRFVLKHVQGECKLYGLWDFNFDFIKTGKTVTKIKFKIWRNTKQDPNHAWVKIQKALRQELPYYMRFTEEQQQAFNYLFTSSYDLVKVCDKFQYVHKTLVRRKEAGNAAKDPFAYTWTAITEVFPPPG